MDWTAHEVDQIKYVKKIARSSNYRFYTVLRHVSTSGMTRDIAVLAIHNKQIVNITNTVADILDRKVFNDGVRCNGCGMDMGFELIYSLSMKLYCSKKFNQDKAYKLSSSWV